MVKIVIVFYVFLEQTILSVITKMRFTLKTIQHDINLIKQKLFGYEIGTLEVTLKQYDLHIPFINLEQWTQFEVLIENEAVNNSFVSKYYTNIFSSHLYKLIYF